MINTIRNTVFIGKVFHHFDELASTNQYAIDLLSKNKPTEGTVISAYNQTQGRGQIGSKWESEAKKNLTASIILYPHFLQAKHQFQLNQIICLAVIDFLSKYIKTGLKIKWPNDIYIKRNKIAGILLQNTLQGAKIVSSIVGMGININQTTFQTAPNPTSLKLENQVNYDLDELLIELCQAVEQRYLQLKRNDLPTIQQNYLDYLYQFDEIAAYRRKDGRYFEGKIVGIDAIGKLKIQHNNQIETFSLKELSFL